MRTGTRIFLVALVAVLLLGLATAGASSGKVYVRDSTQHYKVKPRRLYFAYPALFPPFKITRLRPWHHWGDDGLYGCGSPAGCSDVKGAYSFHGRLHYDDCDPNCAEGHYRRVRATV